MKIRFAPWPEFRCDPQRAAARAECCIGDAITMIPPVTGNGMSMAFESAEMADRTAGGVESRRNFVDANPANAGEPMRRRVCAPAGLGQMAATHDARAVAAECPRPVRRAQRMVLANSL